MSDGFRIIDKRHPAPVVAPPPATPSPPLIFCFTVLPSPDAHDRRLCTLRAGHTVPHLWEYCASQVGEYECPHACELLAGHDGQRHRITFEWD